MFVMYSKRFAIDLTPFFGTGGTNADLFNLRTGCFECVKIFWPDSFPAHKKEFEVELQYLNLGLTSPHLVCYGKPFTLKHVSVEREDVRQCLPMPLFPGTLQNVLDKAHRNPLPAPIVTKLAQALGSGIALLEAAGYCHCDIKPGNIAITPNGDFTLIDFGSMQPAGASLADLAVTSSFALCVEKVSGPVYDIHCVVSIFSTLHLMRKFTKI